MTEGKIIDMLEGYALNMERAETNAEMAKITHEVAQRIIKLEKVNYKMPTKEELWGIIKETFKNTNRYVIEGDNTTVGMVDFDELAQAILDRLKI